MNILLTQVHHPDDPAVVVLLRGLARTLVTPVLGQHEASDVGVVPSRQKVLQTPVREQHPVPMNRYRDAVRLYASSRPITSDSGSITVWIAPGVWITTTA